MAKQTINLGAVANDGTGDTLRDAGTKINANFTELYAGAGGGGGGGTALVESLGAGVDNADAINALLNTGGIDGVTLGAGAFGLSKAIRVPTGKFLKGQALGATTLIALSGFDGGSGNAYDGMVYTQPGATDIEISGLILDGNKKFMAANASWGANGIRVRPGSRRVTIRDIIIRNITNYACHIQGQYGSTPNYAGDVLVDNIRTENCKVHLEVTCGEDVTFNNFACVDGDGDIVVEAVMHPLEGARRVTYQNGRINVVATPNAVALSVVHAAAAYGCDRISVINVDAIVNGIAVVATAVNNTLRHTNFKMLGSTFRSMSQIGANFGFCDGRIDASGFTGIATGFQSYNGKMAVYNGRAVGIRTTSNDIAIGALGDVDLTWDGGYLEGVTPADSEAYRYGYSGAMNVSSTTLLVPSLPGIMPKRQDLYGIADLIPDGSDAMGFAYLTLAPLDAAKVGGTATIFQTYGNAMIADSVSLAAVDTTQSRVQFRVSGGGAVGAGLKLRYHVWEWL